MKRFSKCIAAVLVLATALCLCGYSSPMKSGNYTAEVDFVIWDSRTDKLVDTVDEDKMNIADLKANQIFAPRLKVTNKSTFTKYPDVKVLVNTDEYTWDPYGIEPNTYHGYAATGAYRGRGTYLYLFYVDDVPVCSGYYIIEESKPPITGSDVLSGYWSDEQVSTRVGHNSSAYILDRTVKSCTSITVDLKVTDYTGYPFDYWYVDGRDPDGNWSHLGSFKLKKEDVGKAMSYLVDFKKPQTFDALCIVNSNSYNAYTISYDLSFRDARTIG